MLTKGEAAFLTVVLGALIIMLSPDLPALPHPAGIECNYHGNADNQYCRSLAGIASVFDRFKEALANNDKAVLGIATVAIAWFTFVLWQSTHFLWIAAKKQADLAKRHLRLAERDLTSTRRAFVYILGLDRLPLPDKAGEVKFWRFVPEWKNGGTTPAKRLSAQINWTHKAGELPATFAYGFDKPATLLFLGPQATAYSEPVDIPVACIANKDINIFVWGRVDYADVFENTRPHFTEFCFKVSYRKVGLPGEDGLLSVTHYGSHNRSDEDSDGRETEPTETAIRPPAASIPSTPG